MERKSLATNFKLNKLDLSNIKNYKELLKNLTDFQKYQAATFEKSINKRSISPNKKKPNFDISMLKNSGLLSLNEEQEKVEGVDISLDEIERAFKIIEEKSNGGKVSLNELKKKMAVINPLFPQSELSFLTNGKQEISSKELYEILKDNEIQNFDPVSEAFSLLDSDKNGTLDLNRLKQVFSVLGYGNIDKKDMEILHECLDADKDGKITLKDLNDVYNGMKRNNS